MSRAEVQKLLGGHAAGILTEAERRVLYAAALEDQDLFDTLMDEEALRELLADPQAKARLLAALAPAPALAPPKAVPLWRRPGVLGAAAGVLMASLAGLTWLRSPQAPPPVRQEPAAPKALSLEAPSGAPAEPTRERRVPAQPRPSPKAAPPQEVAPPPAAGIPVPEAAPGPAPTPAVAAPPPPPAPAAQDRLQKAAETPARVMGGAAAVEVLSSAPGIPSARAKAAGAGGRSDGASAQALPAWTLAPQPDGTTLVTVTAPSETQVWLLRRGAGAVEVLQDRGVALKERREARRRYQVRLMEGDALDLYVLAHPVADPAKLPETGPLAGFRARIFPAEK